MKTEKGCPTLPYFGASYPDACCIDGYLWEFAPHSTEHRAKVDSILAKLPVKTEVPQTDR
jgi:hypothetical protein